MEIDAEQEARRYIGDVKRDIERMFSPNVIRQAHRQIDMAAASPGLTEVALLDRMIDLIVGRAADYDLVVFDTAPTGHTLQLLRMPEAITTWIQALVRHRRALVEIDRGSEQTRDSGREGRSGARGAGAPPASVSGACAASSRIAGGRRSCS